MKFKEGDRVKIIENCSGALSGEIGILKMKLGELFAITKHSGCNCGCSCQYNWILQKNNFENLLKKYEQR